MEQELYRAVLLLLKELLAVRRLFEGQFGGGQILETERVGGVDEQGHDVVGPVPDVGLSHARNWICLSKSVNMGRGSAMPP